MDSRIQLPDDIWNLILLHINENNLRTMSIVSKHLYDLIQLSQLLKRPKWYGVNYHKLTSVLEEINLHAGMYQYYPLRNGDLAFGLKETYRYWWDQESKAKPKSDAQFSAPSWSDHRDILVLRAGSNQVLKLSGHESAVKHIIQHNANTLISLGSDNTIFIWEKSTGKMQRRIEMQDGQEPLYLFSINNDRLACVYKEGVVRVRNLVKRTLLKKPLITFNQQQINSCSRLEYQLLIEHTFVNEKKKSNKLFTIWDIENNEVSVKIDLNTIANQIKYNPDGRLYSCTNIEVINYRNHILVTRLKHIYSFFDTQTNQLIFTIAGIYTQYRFLDDGEIVILYHTVDGWHVRANYSHELKDFKIKFTPGIEKSQNSNFYNTCYAILSNGNIVIYDWKTGASQQWSLLSQEVLPRFSMQDPSLPLKESYPSSFLDKKFMGLVNGDILACSHHGTIVIWDGLTGAIKIKKSLISTDEPIPLQIEDKFECDELANGNIYAKWRKTFTPYAYSEDDNYRGGLLRFNLFNYNPNTKVMSEILTSQIKNKIHT